MPDNSLYWYGNECTSLTGGWSESGYSNSADSVSMNTGSEKLTNYIRVRTYKDASYHYTVLGISNLVNTSEYSKLVADIDTLSTLSNCQLGMINNKYVNSATININSDATEGWSAVGKHIVSINALGNNSLYCYARAFGYDNAEYNINSVWFE